MSKSEIQLVDAQRWANKLVEIFKPVCTDIRIAGSVRRNKPTCGDIELVVLLDRTKINPFAKVLYDNFKVGIKRESRMIKFFYERVQVDMFIPLPEEFIRVYAIRTGSAEFAHKKLANAWVRLGWVGTEDGLRRRSECEEIRVKAALGTFKSKWVCKSTGSNISKPPHFETEEQLFGFLGLPWTPPENRI